ncbi:hypothetical protein S7711_10233 [Stachybotrys chartarum IBT 7711]|uniref:Xylanolytic transcriptional activator regulatory domain-containing protein n=1 Tax=Stachybotrys chartarum (strain CBS 109288 / IBT 7711) TaxID=1280523 RepID=A0A084AF35_STACB|nr:hypothetical protein S7711_10233 [Stachybotrys chartarum IBT 7711]
MVHAQSKTRFNLEWSLTSTAARHCLSMGYHREERVSQLQPLEAERARRLFWHVYLFDKNLSSRLGRTSIIQDYDVDLSLCTVSEDPGREPWDSAFNSFVELSRIQGQIYESLYSAATRDLDVVERSQRVSRLESRLNQWYDTWSCIDVSVAYDRETFDSTFGPISVIYFSILTLCHRGATLSNSAHDIAPACYHAAHQGLKTHLAHCSRLAFSDPPQVSTYTLWIFYYTSFTPFVVSFLHCIANSDLNDLQLLGDVLESLEQFGPMFEYSERQFHLCKALYRIAEAYIESPKTITSRESQAMSTICLPLQNHFACNWSWHDSELQLIEFADTFTAGWELPGRDDA